MRVKLSTLLTLPVIASVFLFGGCGGKKGPPPLSAIAEEKKIEKRIIVQERLTSQVGKLKDADIEPPKRVGLLSFYLWDVGEIKYNAMARQYGGTVESKVGMSSKGANHFATKLAEKGVPELKKVFAEHGMELLEPVDFVTSEEQRKAYVNFVLPKGKIGGAGMALADWASRSPKVSSAAAGFSGIPTHLWMDAHGLRALEELRQKMGLDAWAVLANTTFSNNMGSALNGIILTMYGPNPVPKPPQKLAQIAWAPDMFYAHGSFSFGKEGWTPLAYTKKGKITHELYEGYDKIVEVLADVTLDTFDKQYGK